MLQQVEYKHVASLFLLGNQLSICDFAAAVVQLGDRLDFQAETSRQRKKTLIIMPLGDLAFTPKCVRVQGQQKHRSTCVQDYTHSGANVLFKCLIKLWRSFENICNSIGGSDRSQAVGSMAPMASTRSTVSL